MDKYRSDDVFKIETIKIFKSNEPVSRVIIMKYAYCNYFLNGLYNFVITLKYKLKKKIKKHKRYDTAINFTQLCICSSINNI